MSATKWKTLTVDKDKQVDRIETSDTVYLILQTQNTDQTNASPISTLINQQKQYNIPDMSEYNWHVYGLLLTTREFPIFNIRKQLTWDNSGVIPAVPVSNFQINRTNMSISILWGQDGSQNVQPYPAFTYDFTSADRNLLLYPIGTEIIAGSKTYAGLGCFLQYESNNTDNPLSVNPNLVPTAGNTDGINTSLYDNAYFNVYSVQKVINMINNAIKTIMDEINPTYSGLLASISALGVYPQFKYDGNTGLISFVSDNIFFNQPNDKTNNEIALGANNSCLQFYFNDYLAKILDGFNYLHFNDTLMSTNPYQGIDNLLLFRGAMNNQDAVTPQYRIQQTGYMTVGDVYGYNADTNDAITYNSATTVAEYPTLSNMFDGQSINIVSNSGSFNSIKQSYVPLFDQVGDDTSGSQVPASRRVLKNLDFIFDNLTEAQLVNAVVQFETNQLDLPLNGNEVTELKNVYINFERVGMDNSIMPLEIGPGGIAKIKLCGKRIAKF